MNLEVLLSVMNLNKSDLDKMNIRCKCTVINQCSKTGFSKYKNFDIYSYNEKGLAVSRNRGLEHVTGDIVILCDDDVVYNDNYEKIIIDEFKKNKNADIIIFNIESPNRKIRINKKNKRLHFYSMLTYSSQRIAFKRDSVIGIKFNTLFGAGSRFSCGEEALFLVECLNKGLNIYSNNNYIGVVNHTSSTWFNGYNEKFFFDRGALFTAINPKIKNILMCQYLIRHKEVRKNINFFEAFRIMKSGSREYLKMRGISHD